MFVKQAIYNRTSIPLVAKTLDASALRGKAIADNMANLTTPGYRRIEVDFESKLQQALDPNAARGRKTDARHLDVGAPEPLKVLPGASRSNDPVLPGEINNVDIDMEMSTLAENSILFQYGARFITDRKSDIEKIIKEVK